MIACWKAPFDPLTIASDVPFADSSTVVLPAGFVHTTKPLPVMVTVPPG